MEIKRKKNRKPVLVFMSCIIISVGTLIVKGSGGGEDVVCSSVVLLSPLLTGDHD